MKNKKFKKVCWTGNFKIGNDFVPHRIICTEDKIIVEKEEKDSLDQPRWVLVFGDDVIRIVLHDILTKEYRNG